MRTADGAATETRSATESRYFRGMDGDRATPTGGTKSVSVADSTGAPVVDHWRLHGQTREEVTFNGVGGAEVSGAISDPWLPSTTTASDGSRTAMFAGVASTRTREAVTSGARTTTQNTTYDTYGAPVTLEDLGQVTPALTGDETCARSTYVRNTTA